MEQFLPANLSNTNHYYLQSQNIIPPVLLNSGAQVQYCPAIPITMPAPLSAQGNEEAWVTATSSYDSLDWQKKLTSQVRSFIRQNASWLSLSSPPTGEVKVLDYACGPGVVSLAILPYTTHLTGLDVNPQQVAEYNRRVTLASLPETHIKAEVADLFIEESAVPAKFALPSEEYSNFDYAFCSAALHHVDDPALGVKRLAERVKGNGGRVVIVEFLAREGEAGDGGQGIEERKKENAEYREHSHDNRHLVEGTSDGASHGHHHHHGHGHGHKHGEGHEHHHHHHHHHEEEQGAGGEGEAKRKHGHGPHGFKVEVMEGYFKDAGLVDVQSLVMPEKANIMGIGDFEVFMTQGRKA
ncbi:hypothetical protein TWF694_008956 [Orbilia ellipsospora]|uniref:S-adenosyl-L-methionine-dependent methyltransferase n=1 Tax=Orbilia ellipsospora TaxID=2528407 RepID=A0AAV9XG74_9PEZI